MVGETGWPTEEIPFPTNENPSPQPIPFANIVYAEEFIKNAVALNIPMYLFEAFDEQLKSVDKGAGYQASNVENHWGIFTESGQLKYNIIALSKTLPSLNGINLELENSTSSSSDE